MRARGSGNPSGDIYTYDFSAARERAFKITRAHSAPAAERLINLRARACV